MGKVPNDLSVGQLSDRSGVPVSALHFYEAEGLIEGWRTSANHRRYDRAVLRRVAIIKVAQSVGLSLNEIRDALNQLPPGSKIQARDWETMSQAWRVDLNERIESLIKLRDKLGSCIGCGCLSLDTCPLYNPNDDLSKDGHGPRRWIGKTQ